MNKLNTKVLVQAAIMSAVAAVFMIMSYYVPFLMFLGVLIWPIPITYLTFKYNIKVSALSLIVALLVAATFIDPLSALSMGILYGVSAIVLGFCLRKKYSTFVTIIAVALAMFISYIVTLEFQMLLTHVDIMKQTYKLFDESIAKSKELMLSFGITNEQLSKTIPQQLNSEYLKMVLPGILALTSLIGAFINYYIIGVIFRKLRIKINELKPMDEWYINNNLSFGVFFITLVSGIMVYLKVNNSDVVFNSIFIIFSFIFQIDGFAVIFWFLKGKGVKKKSSILIIGVFMLTGLSALAFYLGLVDYIFDFRKINPARRRRIPPGE